VTAVRAPFVFTSDRWEDRFVDLALRAGCRSLALQFGSAPAHAVTRARDVGLQVIGWGISDALTPDHLADMRPDVWMPQFETTKQFEDFISLRTLGVGSNLPIEPVATSGGMETEKPNATPTQVEAERNRRRDLLASFGIKKVWVEVYRQDADKHGQAHLGNVDLMCSFFKSAYGFDEAHPVLGLWTPDASEPWSRPPYRVTDYLLDAHGRTFGAWRAEQMEDVRYDEIAAVPPRELEELMEAIGRQHGVKGFADWLRTQPDVQKRGPKYDPENINTWPWPDKLERTLGLLVEDHDARADE
jgi:hypothetical protein